MLPLLLPFIFYFVCLFVGTIPTGPPAVLTGDSGLPGPASLQQVVAASTGAAAAKERKSTLPARLCRGDRFETAGGSVPAARSDHPVRPIDWATCQDVHSPARTGGLPRQSIYAELCDWRGHVLPQPAASIHRADSDLCGLGDANE